MIPFSVKTLRKVIFNRKPLIAGHLSGIPNCAWKWVASVKGHRHYQNLTFCVIGTRNCICPKLCLIHTKDNLFTFSLLMNIIILEFSKF